MLDTQNLATTYPNLGIQYSGSWNWVPEFWSRILGSWKRYSVSGIVCKGPDPRTACPDLDLESWYSVPSKLFPLQSDSWFFQNPISPTRTFRCVFHEHPDIVVTHIIMFWIAYRHPTCWLEGVPVLYLLPKETQLAHVPFRICFSLLFIAVVGHTMVLPELYDRSVTVTVPDPIQLQGAYSVDEPLRISNKLLCFRISKISYRVALSPSVRVVQNSNLSRNTLKSVTFCLLN